MTKETVYDVASAIQEAMPEYKRERIPVVARVHGDFDGVDDTLWFMVGDQNRSMYTMQGLRQFGRLVPRNSLIATKILNSEVGTDINYKLKNNIKRIVDHHIQTTSKADVVNKVIRIWGDNQAYSYSDVSVFLRALRQNQVEIERKEREIEEQKRQIEELKKQENTAHERGILTKGLNKMEEERRILTMQQEEMSQLTKYIRKQGQLRFNPILDPVQNRIKTQNLYNGVTVVIDGGPGTGKTTTMIQRLKYLTDWDAIEEDFMEEANMYQLNAVQRDYLHQAIKEQRDWVFFSPSKLLKEYLADAMNREGLGNTNAKVWHWAEYRNKAVRENYLLIDPSNDNAPFKASRSEEILFYDCAGIIKDFTEFFLSGLRQIRNRFPMIEASEKQYLWIAIAQNIQKRFEGCENFTIPQFIQLFISLEQIYSKECRELLSENRTRISAIADEIYLLCEDRSDIYEQLQAMMNAQTTEQNDDAEDEVDNADEADLEEANDTENRIISMIRTWYKRVCYNKKNPEAKLTARQIRLSELIMPVLTEEHISQMGRIGELALFEQFAKYTRGVRSNLLGGFPAKYKRFRRQMLARKDSKWNQKELDALLRRREGKELHSQEQALLIGFINNLVKMILKASRTPVNHIYVNAYLELNRPIVGVDEVTDFSECDIYAMQSLLHDGFNSMTLCGDLMQRLTTQGIKTWKAIEPLVDNMKLMEMRTSYRQSARLLNVAQSLYHDTIGEEPKYKAYMKSTKVPAPLALVSDDEQTKIYWIEKRIMEVYNAYGKRLPSIAIFLNKKNDIPAFVDALRDTDFVYDSGIEIVDGSEGNVLASSNQIRVYPIDVVKGMEFDVVFFHNIDDAIVSDDVIKRYIYVGVSRAAFFLGITLSTDKADVTKYFEKNKDWTKG